MKLEEPINSPESSLQTESTETDVNGSNSQPSYANDTQSSLSYASIPTSNAESNSPSYANPSVSNITPGIENRLKKGNENDNTTGSNTANNESLPAYLQFSKTNNSSTTSSTNVESAQITDVPSYAKFSATAQSSSTNTENRSSATGEGSSVPLYAQFNNMSINSKQNDTTSNYMQNSGNLNSSYTSYASGSTTNPPVVSQQPVSYRNQSTPAPIQPKFVPARQDYVYYHGYRSENRTSAPAPPSTTTPTQATSWMNVYASQSHDELFVLEEWFKSVDQDNSGEIDSSELEAALNAAGDKFEKGTISLMVKIFDIDRNGTIEFNEFVHLFKYINVMRQSFESFDSRKQGFLTFEQTQAALTNARYDFSDPKTFQMLYRRFCNKPQGMTFEDFMQMAIFLGNLRTLFTLHDTDKRGSIQLNAEEFILLDCVPYT
uniref:EF-hand domain-containing protein n=1 Tax=Vannella robusta TaxID=1487602 RepID=A0A7S4I862_9EUKA